MTAQEFDHLDESEKKIVLFEAQKIAENYDDSFKTEWFKIDDFFIESRISRSARANRILKVYASHRMDPEKQKLFEDYA